MGSERLTVRAAALEDCEAIWGWRNHEAVRAASFDQGAIALEDHARWYRAALADPDRALLVAELDAVPAACVRFDRTTHGARVSIFADPARIGCGIGTPALRAAEGWLRDAWPDVENIVAEIRKENVRSRRAFEKAGYCGADGHFVRRLKEEGMSQSISIAGRRIGPDEKPYVIAELSGNHMGRLDLAIALLEEAARRGADAVKLQTYTPDTITIAHDGPGFTVKGGLWDGRTLHDLYAEAHTPFEWHAPLFARAREIGVAIFSSPFDPTAVDLLESLDAPAYKVASFELVDLPLVARIARTGKPMIMSTGMASSQDIADAVATARDNGAREIVLLHCVSSYPARFEQANLRTIPDMAARYGCLVGLSDHTPGTAAAVTAIALGACVIEKHVTMRRADGGVDSAFSLEPEELQRLKEDCDNAHAALGRATFERSAEERANMQFRRSLYVTAAAAAGEVLTGAHVRSIRPGYGLPPRHLPEVLGRRAKRDLAYGEPLAWDMLD
ncbi:MAG: pseudaminic acid synthase [Caulobacterales bacterium]